MEVFNVLFKGVEITSSTFCRAFAEEETAREWIKESAKRKGLEIKSSFGWDDERTLDDYRTEDSSGNSFYYVIYRQIVPQHELYDLLCSIYSKINPETNTVVLEGEDLNVVERMLAQLGSEQ